MPKAERLSSIKNLNEKIIAFSDTKVDLYKMWSDLEMIFSNEINPSRHTETIPSKMIFGRHVERDPQKVSDTCFIKIIGFLPSSEVPEVIEWIKASGIQTYDGYSEMFDNLSEEIRELYSGTWDAKAELYSEFIRPLIVLYFTAMENKNSILFVEDY